MNPRLLSILLLFSVSPCFATVKINTTSIPNGTAKSAYSAVIQAYNGCLPYKWTIVSGSLPPGVKATASSSTTALDLSGTPTTAASYSFTVKVTGCGGGVSQASYKVVIQGGANHIVDLSWKPSSTSTVVGYNIYRSPNAASWVKINSGLVGSTLYTDSTVSNGSTYYYSATAVDSAGKESVKTAAVKAVVP
jgi:large repetitive protein